MPRPRVLILRAAGTNCDLETQHAWELAAAEADRVHIGRLIEHPEALDGYQILTLPGGFSYGDDIAAGRIFAARVERHLFEKVRKFIDAGKLVLGVCNGFQVLVRLGFLPFSPREESRTCTVTYNDPAGFQDRWVRVQTASARCAFLDPGRTYEMPIAHGEGRVAFSPSVEPAVIERSIALRYVGDGVGDCGAPPNPNGSAYDIAGMCDTTGCVLGLMPHPERFVTWTQHPCWTSKPPRDPGDGLALFQRAVERFR